jgi:hypothetical protein
MDDYDDDDDDDNNIPMQNALVLNTCRIGTKFLAEHSTRYAWLDRLLTFS